MAITALALMGGFAVGAAALSGKCLAVGPISFGCSQETVIRNHDELVQDISEKIHQTAGSDIKTISTVSNRLDVVIGDYAHIGTIHTQQTIRGKVDVINEINHEMAGAIEETLLARFDASMRDSKVSEGIAALLKRTPNGTSLQEFATKVRQTIIKSTTQEVMDEVLTETHLENEATVRLGNHAWVDKVFVGQDVVVEIFVRNAISTVMGAIHDLKVVTEIEKEFVVEDVTKTSGSETVLIVAGVVLLALFLWWKMRKST